MKLSAILAVLALTSAPALAGGILDTKGKAIGDYTIELEGRYWFAKLSGDIRAEKGSIPGTSVDFPDELNLDAPSRPLIEGVGRLRLDKFQVRAAYFQALFEHDTRVEKSFTFEGHSFSVGRDISSEATLRVGALDANYILLDVGKANNIGLKFGVGIGGRYLGFEGRIKDDLSGISGSAKEKGYLPVVSAFASVAVANIFMISVEAGGIRVPNSFPKVHGTFIDAAAELRVYLHESFFIAGGYRFLMLRATYDASDDVEADVRLQGFFAGIGITF